MAEKATEFDSPAEEKEREAREAEKSIETEGPDERSNDIENEYSHSDDPRYTGNGFDSPMPTGPTPEEVAAAAKAAADEVRAALRAAENKRFQDLISLYGGMKGVSPIDIGALDNPKEMEAAKKANDLIALSVKSGKIGQQARTDLSNLTKMNASNRDAWLQYYNPAALQAQGASATAAQGQATLASMAPAEVGEISQATGKYQTDLAPLTSYDPTISRSEERARAVGLADLMEARARGEVPSVAAEQYKAGLDRLLQSQQAAVASQRGPASSLALRGAQTQAGQLGQQAVRETAILRMQEQKEAEQLAANQSNLIMIEDQKLSSQQKLNELNQRVQIVSADLQNTRNLLDRDMFNAEAINKANMLEAQLRTDIEKLNAEMQTNASLTNAEMATRASIASADNATRASIASAQNALTGQMWAGDNAQRALGQQMAMERADWSTGYGIQRDSLRDQQAAIAAAAASMEGLSGRDFAREQLAYNRYKDDLDREAREEAADAAQTQGWISMLASYAIPAVMGWAAGGPAGAAAAVGAKVAANKMG
jgi:hypothetical protein